MPDERSSDALLRELQERAKELTCLFRVDEILNRSELDLAEALVALVAVLPHGLQYPEICQVQIVLEDQTAQSPEFRPTHRELSAPIVSEGETIGQVAVSYVEQRPDLDEGPFLKEERRLISAVAERIGYRVLQRRLRAAEVAAQAEERPWAVIIDFLRATDRALLHRVTRRMINHLSWSGVEGAEALRGPGPATGAPGEATSEQDNRPQQRMVPRDLDRLADRTFELAAGLLPEDEILGRIQGWITEEKAGFLYSAAEHRDAPLSGIAAAIDRFQGLSIKEADLPDAMQRGLRVNLLRRFFTDQVEFINIAKGVTRISDFFDLVRRVILTPESRGKLGGKSAGLFLASRVIREAEECRDVLANLRVPKTWYIPSDALFEFLSYNNMQDVYDRKYREIELIRQDYPYLVQAFKAAQFPADLTQGLAAALDDFEERPLIVRSSSLLEDRSGSAFSGKYKSLFLGNQGSKRDRLAALQDAIAEVYASVFGPDPIEYRIERGLLDVHEEMGIMIQEVVGTRLGDYFLPAFSGVAFSHADFRWSSRIRREDGLIRLVPGLGTRAVDRLSDDYPVLLAPGQPALRVNHSVDEIVRYSPRKVDVINLTTNGFETMPLRDLLRRHGAEYPAVGQIVVRIEDGRIRRPGPLAPDFERDELAVTFDGLFTETPFVARIRTLLAVLQRRMGVPVDIEFASDGTDLYLLQCRAQGYGAASSPAAIPRDVPAEQVLFTARRYVSNGRVPDVTHVVYVEEDAYGRLSSPRLMREVGDVVGRLNRLLPKRRFVLMGPGRWGSRGDITLGVPVTYSQINNTAVLIEIARQKGNYVPDLSFGTHFFQDLVEGGIRYLPLYPDDPQVAFNVAFFRHARNILPDLVPDAAHLADVIHVIDVAREREGQVLRILMNAELDEAIGLLAPPWAGTGAARAERGAAPEPVSADHWRWRLRMAERIAELTDPARFGVKAMYLVGSTRNASAGPDSDVDLIVHVADEGPRRDALNLWLEGWSRCLAEMNYLRTGYRSQGLLDVHYVTDRDLADPTGFAAKIGAATDAARPLPLGKAMTDDERR